MRPARLPYALSLAVLSLAALSAGAPARADEWSRTYPVSGAAALVVDTNDGRVTVTSWERPEIAIHVTTAGWKIGSSVTLDAVQSGSRVELTARTPNTVVEFFPLTSHWLHIEVSVPRKCDLDLHTGDGSVTVERVTGHARVRSGDGHVSVMDSKGDLDLRTSDGSIDATGVDGRLSASSSDGHISVNGRFDSLDLSSGDGRIEAEAQRGSLLSDGWDLDTSDGGIRLRIPGDLKANLDASTGDGGISVDVPVEVQGSWRAERRLHGTMNGGGPLIRLRTADGSIRVEKL